MEDTKLNSRKRGGVVHFIRYFPVYVGRIEVLMIGTEGLEIRQSVDAAYDRIVKAMFESLKRMAKLDGEGEDKGQLNYHVILIGASTTFDFRCFSRGLNARDPENMHHFVTEIQSLDIGSVSSFLVQAEAIYDESLAAYVRLVLRRPFLKILVGGVPLNQVRMSAADDFGRITLRVLSGCSKPPRRPRFKTTALTPDRLSRKS